jgi:dUTP pyrophosphatase
VLIYLASPIDLVPLDGVSALTTWRTQARDGARSGGWSMFDPSSAFVAVGGSPTPHFQAINNEALRQSDAVLALFPPGVSTIGTPMEVQKGLDLGKPVAVVGAAHSWALAGCGAFRADSVPEALAWLATAPAGQPILRFAGDGQLPTQAHPGEDAGFDLYTSKRTHVPAGEWIDIPCGISAQFPPGIWGLILGRSSAMRARRLRVHPGVIDSGFRGTLFVLVENIDSKSVYVDEGERVGQLIPLPLWVGVPERVTELAASSRGAAGFGSSGA